MREKVVRFGTTASLVGILSEPRSTPQGDRTGVILLNSGILHRVGACRLHVQIARRLATAGFPVLRFDFSGIGDSEARRDSLPFEESAVLETREAMDYLGRTKGVDRFVVIGLCSGADVAFMTANADDRIVGMGQLDAWFYPTFRAWLNHYGPRMLSLSKWTGLISRRIQKVKGALEPPPEPTEDMELPTYVREFPPKSKAEQELSALAGQGMEFLYIYSGGQEGYNYRGQFADAFRSIDFGERLVVEFLPEADHIFTRLDHQGFVVDRVAAWMERFAPVGEEQTVTPELPSSPAPRRAPRRAVTAQEVAS